MILVIRIQTKLESNTTGSEYNSHQSGHAL
jgi:hypothetical protein